jgi:hypothetical protein
VEDAFKATMALASDVSFTSFQVFSLSGNSIVGQYFSRERASLQAANGVNVQYTARLTSPQTPAFYSNLLDSVVTGGQFTGALQTAATANHATGLQSASSPSLSANQASTVNSSTQETFWTTTNLVIIIVVCGVGLLLIGVSTYCYVQRKKAWEMELLRQENSRNNNEFPFGSRDDLGWTENPQRNRYSYTPAAFEVHVEIPGSPIMATAELVQQSSPSSRSSSRKNLMDGITSGSKYDFPQRQQSIKKSKFQRFNSDNNV